MNFWKILTALILLAFFGSVFAANNYSLSLNFVEARSTSYHSYSYQQMANVNDSIDVKASLFMDNWGNEPYKKAYAYSEIYGIKNNQSVFLKKTFTQYFYIFPYGYDYSNFASSDVYGYPIVYDYYPYGSIVYYYPYPYYDTVSYPVNDSKSIYWNNAFTVDGQYEDYKVVVSTGFEGKGISDTEYAYVHVLEDESAVNGNVDGINSNNGTTNSGNAVSGNATNQNTNTTSTNTSNSTNTPVNTNSGTTVVSAPLSTCGQIGFFRNDLVLNENSSTNYSQKFINNSDSTFYVDSVSASTSDSFLSVQRNYFEPIVFANDIGSIELKISTKEVPSDPIGTITLKISGHFGDGIQCNSSQIQQTFNVTVNDLVQSSSTVVPDSLVYSTVGQSGGTFKSSNSTDNGAAFTILLSDDPVCSDVYLNTQDFELKPNELQYKTFSFRNYSDQSFYIDSAFVEDAVDGIVSELWKNPSFIDPNGSAGLGVKVMALNSSNGVEGNANVKIRGHFSDGTTCYASDISSDSFHVRVTAPTQSTATVNDQTSCSGFKFEAPFNAVIPSSGNGKINISIKNPLNESAKVSLSGIDVSPKTIYVEKNSTVEKTLSVNTSKNAYLDYYIEYKCGAFAQSTKISAEKEIIVPLGSRIEINAATKTLDKGYQIEVELKNKSNETISGTIDLQLPSDWNVSGEKSISVKPNETKTAIFTATPPKDSDKDFKAKVLFRNDGQSVSKEIEFKQKEQPLEFVRAAFALLSGNAILIGLLILIALVVIAIFSVKRYPKQEWEKQ